MPTPTTTFTLASTAFAEGGTIPREYTCQGADTSPPLLWEGTPTGTLLYLLIVEDLDASNFVHWTIRIEGTDGDLPPAISPDSQTDIQGVNGFGRRGWGGPCPPSGTHRYRFTLYALGSGIDLSATPTISEVRTGLANATILATTELTGTYRKT